MMCLCFPLSGRDRNKTYKPVKDLPKGRDKQKTINATMKATLGGGELKQAVKLPPGEDLNEWIAVNSEHLAANSQLIARLLLCLAVHFYNAANMICMCATAGN